MEAHEQVALLEEEIERLAERIESCRKLSTLAKGLTAAGLAGLALLIAGVLGRSPPLLVFGIAATLGGLVLLGSNRTTLERLRERLAAVESRRAETIAGLDLRLAAVPSRDGAGQA